MGEGQVELFWARVNKSSACWVWQGYVMPNGYGSFRWDGVTQLAHRLSYFLAHGPIPDGLQLDHLCRTRHCVNPAHLEAVTQQENIRRGEAGKHWADKTHCPQGHPYAGTNLYVAPSGARNCRACTNRRAREYRARRRGSA